MCVCADGYSSSTLLLRCVNGFICVCVCADVYFSFTCLLRCMNGFAPDVTRTHVCVCRCL